MDNDTEAAAWHQKQLEEREQQERIRSRWVDYNKILSRDPAWSEWLDHLNRIRNDDR
jgi:hypothetical protein